MNELMKRNLETASKIVAVEQTTPVLPTHINEAVDDVKGKIVTNAISKINDDKIIEKHSRELADITDEALSADIETERLKTKRKRADNSAEKQSIHNKLIELKTEAIRLKREKKQILREQKAEHKKRNDDIAWEKYKGKLEKMKYSYVPNKFILCMLLFFDGIISFFNGLGAISTAIMKAVRWLAIIALILAVIFAIPATRNWFTNLLGF